MTIRSKISIFRSDMPKMPEHKAGRQYFTISDLPFFAIRTSQSSFAPHDHDFFEMVLVLEGKAEHQIYGTKYKISRGDVLIIPVHQAHAYLHAEKLEIINALFEQAEFEKLAFDLPKLAGYQRLFSKSNSSLLPAKRKGCLSIPPAKFAAVVSLLANFISEIEGKRPGYKAMAVSLFIQAMGVIARCHEHINTPPLLLSRIEQTLDFIGAHHDENISVDQLAHIAYMSRSSYQRSFGKLMNTSPIDYLIKFRIRKASSLLLYHPEMNVTEIGLLAGFTDSNYFSRMFKKILGYAPRDFRRLNARRGRKSSMENPKG